MIKKRYNFPADRTILVYDFLNRFGVHPNGYIDNLMSAISKHFVIDICKFDDYLHENVGDISRSSKSTLRGYYLDNNLDNVSRFI